MERDPAWSPDGKRVAYFSDQSGEYGLHFRRADGGGAVEKIDLGRPPSFYYSPRWSPDGTKIAYTDRRRNIWYVDLKQKRPIHVAKSDFADPLQGISPPVWAPDSRWL